MKVKTYFLPLSIVALLFLSSCGEDRESIKVTKEDLVESVYSSVTIEPVDVHNVTSSVSGYVDQIFVEDGDEVNAGDTLFIIRDVQSYNNAANARLNMEIARNSYSGNASVIDEMKLDIDNLQLRLQNDSSTYSRNKQLYKNGLITKVEFEQSELAYQSSKNSLENAQKKLKRMQKELKYAYQQAQNTYNSSLSRYTDAIIRSNMNGLVYDITKENGEFVTMQQPVAIIGAKDQFIISMLIDEVDVIRVKKGQEILVSLDAYPDQIFKAKVTRISPKMDPRTQSFEVKGEFDNGDDVLYMGLTGEANIVISKKTDAVVIPREYVIGGEEVETENGRVKVKTGAKSLSHIEIISGLKKGDIIYKPE